MIGFLFRDYDPCENVSFVRQEFDAERIIGEGREVMSSLIVRTLALGPSTVPAAYAPYLGVCSGLCSVHVVRSLQDWNRGRTGRARK